MGSARAFEESVGPALALEEREKFRKNAYFYCVLSKKSFDAFDCLVRSVLCARSCAHVLCGFQNVCEPQTSSARCCADVVRVLCVVFGGDCGFGTFFRVVLCALALVSWAGRSRHLGHPTHFT